MRLSYYPATDSLYVDLAERPASERRDVAEGVVVDFDAEGNVVGIDIDHASRKVRLDRLVLAQIDAVIERTVA